MVTSKQVEEFIDEWLALFPSTKVVPFEGYVKGKAKDSVKKMQKLCKQNKDWDKQLIFAATKMYLVEKYNKGWQFLSRPYYFLIKNNISLLEEYVERVQDGQTAQKAQVEYTPQNEFL